MKCKEILLCKYGEIVLKGANRKYFEDMLCREMKKRAKNYGDFDIYRAQSTIYIEPKDEFADMEKLEKLTGVPVPKNLSGLRERAVRHTTVLDVDEMLDFVLDKAQQKEWF